MFNACSPLGGKLHELSNLFHIIIHKFFFLQMLLCDVKWQKAIKMAHKITVQRLRHKGGQRYGGRKLDSDRGKPMTKK